jgi:hypothetical protein
MKGNEIQPYKTMTYIALLHPAIVPNGFCTTKKPWLERNEHAEKENKKKTLHPQIMDEQRAQPKIPAAGCKQR